MFRINQSQEIVFYVKGFIYIYKYISDNYVDLNHESLVVMTKLVFASNIYHDYLV